MYNGKPIFSGAKSVFFDTGTSFNLIPYNDLISLLGKAGVPGIPKANHLHKFSCDLNKFNSFKDIEFYLKLGQKLSIPKDNWVQRDSGSGTCTVKIMSDKSQDKWIFGLNFFNDYLVEFNLEGTTKHVSLWNAPTPRNHVSKAIQSNSTRDLIDNTQDSAMNDKKRDCQTKTRGIYIQETNECKPPTDTSAVTLQQLSYAPA